MNCFFTRIEEFQNNAFLIKGEESFSYGALWRAVVNASVLIKKVGVGPGERILLFFEASKEYMIALLAVFAVGACAIPLDIKMTRDEIQSIIESIGGRVLLTTSTHREGVEAFGKELLELDWEKLSLENEGEISSCVRPFIPEILGLDREALILFSSGSSGKPKGVVRSRRAVLMQMETLSRLFSCKVGDLMVCAARPQYSYGLENVLAALYGGVTICFLEVFDYNRAREMLEDPRCTIFVGVPFMYEVLVKVKRQRKNEHRLRLVLSAGSPLGEETSRAFSELFHIPITQVYGSSETPSSAINLQIRVNRQYTSVGQSLPGVKIQIVDETGEASLPGHVGEIWIKSLFAAEYYLDQPELTKEHFENGWFRTGDFGYWSVEGLLFIQGRRKSMINVAGNKVNPEEVETVLRQFPGVKEVMVAGIPDLVYGEMIKAILVTEGGMLVDEVALLQYCRRKLTHYKIPRIIEYALSLPRTAMGKLRRENPEKKRRTLS